MAKKKEQKVNQVVTENKNEVVTSTGETKQELAGENMANPEQEGQVTVLKANTTFNDKYTGTVYVEGTEFVVVDEEIETKKVNDKKYKISTKRAKEIKAKGYAD